MRPLLIIIGFCFFITGCVNSNPWVYSNPGPPIFRDGYPPGTRISEATATAAHPDRDEAIADATKLAACQALGGGVIRLERIVIDNELIRDSVQIKYLGTILDWRLWTITFDRDRRLWNATVYVKVVPLSEEARWYE